MKLLQKVEKVWIERLEKARKKTEKPFMQLNTDLSTIAPDSYYGDSIRNIMKDIKRKSFRLSPEDQDKIVKGRNLWLTLAASRRGDLDKKTINEILSNREGYGYNVPYMKNDTDFTQGSTKRGEVKREIYNNLIANLQTHGETKQSIVDRLLKSPNPDVARFVAKHHLSGEDLLNRLSDRQNPMQYGALRGAIENEHFGPEHTSEVLGHGDPRAIKTLLDRKGSSLTGDQYSLLLHNPNPEVAGAAVDEITSMYRPPDIPVADVLKIMNEHPDKKKVAQLWDKYEGKHQEVKSRGYEMMPTNPYIAKEMISNSSHYGNEPLTHEQIQSIINYHGANEEVQGSLGHISEKLTGDQARQFLNNPEVKDNVKREMLDNPHLTDQDLQPFANSEDRSIASKLLNHPNVDTSTIEAVYNHARAKSSNPDDYYSSSWRKLADEALTHAKAPETMKGNISALSEESQIRAAKKTKEMSAEMIKTLATSPHVNVREAMAGRHDLPDEWKKALRADKQVKVRKNYYEMKRYNNQPLTPDDFMAGVNDKAATIRAAIIKHSKITPEALRVAFKHKDPETRALVLDNPNVPEDIANQAANDPSPEVSLKAWRSGKLTPEQATMVYNKMPDDIHRGKFIDLSASTNRYGQERSEKHVPEGVLDDAIARGLGPKVLNAAVSSLNPQQVTNLYDKLEGRNKDILITNAKHIQPQLLDRIIAEHQQFATTPDVGRRSSQGRPAVDLDTVLARPEVSDEHLKAAVAAPNIDSAAWQALARNPKSAQIPEVVSALSHSWHYSEFIEQNPGVTEEHLRSAANNQDPQVRRAVVEHKKVPLDLVRNAMRDQDPNVSKKARQQIALHDPDEFNKVLQDAHTVDVHPAVEKLKHLKGMVQDQPGGTINKRDLKAKFGIQEVPPQVLDGKGNITPESIDSFIQSLPKTRYNISYRHWQGAQMHDSSKPQLVMQMNITNEQVKHLKDAGLYDTFRKVHDMSFRSGHPVEKHTLGWSRIDTSHPGHLHVDEVQSDLGQGTIRQILAAKEKGQMKADEADKYVKDLKEINKYLAGGHKTINHAILSAVHQTARERGVPSVKMSNDQYDENSPKTDKVPAQANIASTSMDLINDQAKQSGQQTHEGAKDLPVHMQQTYEEFPKAMGYQAKPKKEVMPETKAPEAEVNYRKLTKSLEMARQIIAFLKKSEFSGSWASNRPDTGSDATNTMPHPKAPTSPAKHIRGDTMTNLHYDVSEEHRPLEKSDEEPGQYHVDLGVPPVKEAKGKYAQWHVSKKELGQILKDWHKVKWDLRGKSRPSTETKHHATAITRQKMSLPIASYLAHNEPKGRVLYHGVGRDDIGAKALGAEKYDPFHPDPAVRQPPKGPFNEIHSHYTLNVVDRAQGHKILSHIHSLMAPEGKAVISVRRDLPEGPGPLKKSLPGNLRALFEKAKEVSSHHGSQPRDEKGRFIAWDEAAAAAHENTPDDYDAYKDESIWGNPDEPGSVATDDPKLKKSIDQPLSPLASAIRSQVGGQIKGHGQKMAVKFPATAKPENLYASYKQNPHNPIASVLKYAIHRVEHFNDYKTPEGAAKSDADFVKARDHALALSRAPDKIKQNQHSIHELHNILAKAPHLIDGLVQHQKQLHDYLRTRAPHKMINGEPHVALVRGLGSGTRLADPMLTSYADTHEQTLGNRITHMHNHWVPLKNVWYSYDKGPKESHPSHYFPSQDEFLVSPHPLKTAMSTDVKKLVPRKPKMDPGAAQPATRMPDMPAAASDVTARGAS